MHLRSAYGDAAPAPVTAPAAVKVDKEELKKDPKFAKYFRMLAVGVPAPSVYGKMASDGLEPDDVRIFKMANGEAVEGPVSDNAVSLPL
jgi:hypothetical protein